MFVHIPTYYKIHGIKPHKTAIFSGVKTHHLQTHPSFVKYIFYCRQNSQYCLFVMHVRFSLCNLWGDVGIYVDIRCVKIKGNEKGNCWYKCLLKKKTAVICVFQIQIRLSLKFLVQFLSISKKVL